MTVLQCPELRGVFARQDPELEQCSSEARRRPELEADPRGVPGWKAIGPRPARI